MNKLPEPIWISLQETLDLVLDRTGEDPEAARRSLIDAFGARKIETRGRGRNYGGLDPQPAGLGAEWNGATVSWEKGTFCPASGYYGTRYQSFDEIIVRRADVLRWLEIANDGDDAHPPAQGRKPNGGRIGMGVLKPWLQKRYDTWPDDPAGPSLEVDWDAAREEFGRNKVTREQIEKARRSVIAPKSFRINQRGRKPKITR